MIIPPELDSRGLPRPAPAPPAPQAPLSLPKHGPCETCGKAAPWLYFSIEQDRDVYGCPVDSGWECAGRALEAKRAADRAEAAEDAAAEGGIDEDVAVP